VPRAGMRRRRQRIQSAGSRETLSSCVTGLFLPVRRFERPVRADRRVRTNAAMTAASPDFPSSGGIFHRWNCPIEIGLARSASWGSLRCTILIENTDGSGNLATTRLKRSTNSRRLISSNKACHYFADTLAFSKVSIGRTNWNNAPLPSDDAVSRPS